MFNDIDRLKIKGKKIYIYILCNHSLKKKAGVAYINSRKVDYNRFPRWLSGK